MIEIETKMKEWGNSFGIVIPKEKTADEGIKPNDTVKVIITKKEDSLKVKDIFGTVKWKTNTKKLLKEIDKEFE